MVRTAATKTVGGKTLRKGVKNKSTKVGGSSSEKGGNRVCHRKTPEWQQSISNFLTPTSQPTALIGFADGIPVEITVSKVDVHVSDAPDQDKKDSDVDMKQIPEEADENLPKNIKYDKLVKHAYFLESLP